MPRVLYARIEPFSRENQIRNIIRLAEAVNYSERMKRSGVPDKARRKILRRWNAWLYATNKEMRALVLDMSRALTRP